MKITDQRKKHVKDDFTFLGSDFLLIGDQLYCVHQVSTGKVQLVCFIPGCKNFSLNRSFSDDVIDSKAYYSLKDFGVPNDKEVEIVNVEILIK